MKFPRSQRWFPWIASLLALALQGRARGQGVFRMDNFSAPTHVDSAVGPLAGTNVLSMTLAGSAADQLVPAGPTLSSLGGGRVRPEDVSVPGVSPFQYAFVQLVAWDSAQWGTEFKQVPEAALGKTDVVQVNLWIASGNVRWSPAFGSSAIVPTSVPEPSVLSLLGFTGGLLSVFCLVSAIRAPL